MEKRTYIGKEIRLQTREDSQMQTKIFYVLRKISEGASVICYEGHFNSGTNGLLREFYPRDMNNFFTRNDDEQLIFREKDEFTKNFFKERREQFLRPYNMLLETRSENNKLATFIPPFEIYFGSENAENSAETAYIWTQGQPVETFQKICEQIHKNPQSKPETKLFIVLQAIKSLTECICLLHRAELIHRDIKPANFGFGKRLEKILPETISLFDIDTICSVYDEPESIAGSPGYTEPEFFFEEANNLTDIYSIGATLFSAVVVSEDSPRDDYTYHAENYGNLKYLVDNSKLITASKINSEPRLRAILTTIFQKTLCPRAGRFKTCEELLEKLNEACRYLMMNELSQKSINGRKFILREVEKSFDQRQDKNVLTAIQYHLYENPLYKTMTPAEKNLHVLIFGFGNYGQKFLDTCLQLGQMIDINFSATVVSNEASDKEVYFADRPALKDFFDIDADTATCGQSYGKISFEVATIAKTETLANSNEIDNIILELCMKTRPHYIFVAMGNDALNKSAAVACRNALKDLKINCLVNFAQEENLHSRAQGILPIYVNQDSKNFPIHAELERMAFNAHLVWEKNLNVNYHEVRKNFLEPYNHAACLANVLSIKYKLHSLGIDFKKNYNFTDYAKIFVEKNLHKDGKKNSPEYDLRNKLIFVEHKRWLVEKICTGWTQRNLTECSDGETKDKKFRKHVCILTSRADRLLHDNYSAEDWDNMPNHEIEKLDELDKMSVQIHQQFLRRVESNKSRIKILIQRAIEDISAEFSRNTAISAIFSEFKVCLQDILNGDKNKVLLYENLKSVFKKSLQELNSISRGNIENLIDDLDNKFKPVLNSMAYIDYKQIDAAMIDNIPFILTYSTKIALIIPYNIGKNTEIFCNVAAATVVNPARIIYFAMFEQKSEVNQFKKTLGGLVKYLNRKNLRAEIEFVISLNANSNDCLRLESEIFDLGDKKIRRVKVRPLNAKNKIGFFKKYLNRKSNGKFLYLLEKNKTRLSGLLEGGNVYEKVSSFEFNSLNMKFKSFANCEFLNYINKKNFITASDLTELNSSKGNFGEQPAFFEDYKILWRKYRENNILWKNLCNLLDKHSQKSDILVELKRPENYSKTSLKKSYTYFVPPECLRTLEDNILKILKAKKIIEDYAINVGTANSFEVTIKDFFDNEAAYNKLFANPYALFQPESIKLMPKQNSLAIVFDSLIVKDFDLSSQDRRILNLLKFFADKNYLTNLNCKNVSQISFTYATRTIKNLLTVAGKILEIYVWHEVKNSGYFDDVVSGFEPYWGDSEVRNEIDCIAIKDFKVLIIECKARTNIEQNFQNKLFAISEHFGINCTAVLIADTLKPTEEQIARGIAMQNIIVWQKEELENIGATLKKIIDGKYRMKTG